MDIIPYKTVCTAKKTQKTKEKKKKRNKEKLSQDNHDLALVRS